MINVKIYKGYVWLAEDTDQDATEKIHDALSFDVPGREHIPSFKRGQWDGIKRFFNWRAKRFATGLFNLVQRNTGLTFNITEDDRVNLQMPFIDFLVEGKYKLTDYQEQGIKALLKVGSGLVHVATNGGKTAMIAGVCLSAQSQGKKVTILEGRQLLTDQVRASLISSGVTPVGIIDAKKKDIQNIMVIMIPTVYNILKRVNNDSSSELDEECYNALMETDIFIVDECHHAQATSYISTMQLNRQAQKIGLSGTIQDEKTIEGVIIREQFGDIVCTVENDELIKRAISAKPEIKMVEYTTNFGNKVDVFKAKIRDTCFKMQFQGYDAKGEKILKYTFSVPTYTAKIKEFVMNYAIKHNTHFWETIKLLCLQHTDKRIVVMVDWVQLAEELAKFLGGVVMHGATKNRLEILEDFKNKKNNILVVTSVLDEGISAKEIEVIMLANTGSSTRQFKQRIGRGLRKKDGDNKLTVYDFLRYGHKYLIEPSKKRLKLWISEGFDVEIIEEFD